MVAGRCGSGMASELGSMLVTEQINAMRALGTDPIKKLVVPRVVATTIMMPILTIVADAVGILGGLGRLDPDVAHQQQPVPRARPLTASRTSISSVDCSSRWSSERSSRLSDVIAVCEPMAARKASADRQRRPWSTPRS